MKLRDSGMPDEDYWETLFDVTLVLDRLGIARFVIGGNSLGGFAVERSLGRSVAAILQYQLSWPMLEGFGHRELDWPSSNLVVGAAGRWGEAWRWDASFQEDLPADTPAIDFTLGLRVSRRWR